MERGGGERVFQTTSLGRIDVGVCYTRGARSRRWCVWWGRRERFLLWGGGDGSSGMGGSRQIM